MSEREEQKWAEVPFCKHRRKVNGLPMCYAIGCCTIGDMMCNCFGGDCDCEKRRKCQEK